MLSGIGLVLRLLYGAAATNLGRLGPRYLVLIVFCGSLDHGSATDPFALVFPADLGASNSQDSPQEPDVAESAYVVTVRSVTELPAACVAQGTVNALVTFDKRVPNGDGRLMLMLADGRKVTLSTKYISPDEKVYNKDGVKKGEPIDHLSRSGALLINR